MINFNVRQYNVFLLNEAVDKRCLPRYRETSEDTFVKTNKTIQTPTSKYAQDAEYKKELCKLSGISGIQPNLLQSIMGPSEFRDKIIENSENRTFYVTGERPEEKVGIPDSNKLENVKMKIFGGNYHIHTVHSDGSLSVAELLEQAVSYGNEYAKINNKPFIIGITDHNTVEGCKEAVKIIAKNPDKYKNIRVILGCEISTKEDEINGYRFKKPEKYHILTMCINPFEKRLNKFLNYLQEESHNPMVVKRISIKEAFDGIKHQKQCYFALAHPAFPDLGHRIGSDRDVYSTLRETIKHFKDITKERGLYTEAYYSSYFGNLATDKKIYDTIIETCDDIHLYKAGGIDTHGESIFYCGTKIER